ncbi:I78 family peptidase inhibitor [Streptomyces alkaliterrae]|uniref:Proteinase inhibitor I78 n=1 Tax=Streptomyces alkaliterrae TaxID=2213162 RepID=A0A5P0YYL0_9ACTN|nr:I78 family peptidase inhibitor [Streptomyces alkaliterrae]MBB1254709.1 proteinase inhibitor I78 [Streptomyces alkaliterrae]MBB1258027.1 proteinase inhibitor I78 [Streptomyces alkaliterrae]MQS04612.1 proteinase inhibitor I78 [Streptomyces alkaliterrae]
MADRPTTPSTPTDDPESYVGLPDRAAEETARRRGWTTVRSLEPGAMITMEYLEGRLNFTVDNGVVVRCWKG